MLHFKVRSKSPLRRDTNREDEEDQLGRAVLDEQREDQAEAGGANGHRDAAQDLERGQGFAWNERGRQSASDLHVRCDEGGELPTGSR